MNSVVTVPQREMFGPGGSVTREQALAFAKNLKAFKNWTTELSTNFGSELKGITIMDVFPFGGFINPKTKEPQIPGAGFVIANANVSRAGIPVPGFAFIRGNAVCVLVILEDTNTGKEYVATVLQPRVPGAQKMYEEIPAGMMDASNDVAGTAAKELKEELGLTIHGKDLIKLSDMYPSIGGCDEMIAVYAYKTKMDLKTIKNYNKKITGAINENEVIETRIRPYEEFKKACRNGEITDAKAQLALGLYEMNKKEGIVVGSSEANVALNMPLAAANLFGGRRTRKGKGKVTKSHKKRHTRKH